MTSAEIKAQARELGFDLAASRRPATHPELAFLPRVARARLRRRDGVPAAHRRAPRRRAARPAVRAERSSSRRPSTTPIGPYSTECADPGRAQIARYAWGDDYHDVIGARLDALLAWMRDDVRRAVRRARVRRHRPGAGARLRAARRPRVDRQEHLRHQSRSSDRGSSSAEIICSLPLEADAPALDQCGTCTLCLEACPDAGARRARRARLDALHLVSDDRAARRDLPTSDRRGDRRARLRLRHLPGSLPVERRRAALRRSGVAAAAGVGRTPSLATLSARCRRRAADGAARAAR